MKESLKVSGILNIVFSVFYLLFSIIGGVITFSAFIYLLTTGIIFLNYSKLENIKEKRTILLILSIINLSVCFPSGLINLIGLSNEKDNQSRAPNIEPETKRIDVLIKIGIALIALAGLIFISSDWNEFSGYIILIFIIILTMIFYGLYKLFTLKIKLPNSSKLYYLLSNIFVLLIFLTIGNYNLCGEYFSMHGTGRSLYYFVFWIITSLLTINLKKISITEVRIYFSMIFATFSIYNLLLFINFTTVQSLLLINIITLFLTYKSTNRYIINYTKILFKIFIIISGLCLFDAYSVSLLLIILLNIFIINYLNIHNKSTTYEIITPIISTFYFNITLGLLLDNYHYAFNDYILTSTALLSTIYILEMCIKLLKNHIITKRVSVIIYNFMLLVFTIISLFLEEYILLFIIIIRTIMIFAYYFYEYKNNIKDIEYYIIPFNLTMLLISILVYLNNFITIDANIIILSIITLLSFYYLYTKNKILNILTYILLIITNLINVLVSLFNDDIIIVSLCLLSTVLPFILQLLKNNKEHNIISFIYFLITSFIILTNNAYNTYFGIILNILLYTIIFIIFYNNEKYYKYVLLILGLPLVRLINNLNITFDFKYLLINITLIYMLLIIVYKFVKDFDIRKKIFIILSIFIFLLVIFNDNYIFGLYIGIISLILILYSSINDNYKDIFNYSTILFIINILYRLKSIWYKIPLWGYLLFAGLTIIIFATIKELKKSSKK